MFLFKQFASKSLNCYARFYSLGKKCPYDVLRLRRNCTDKEIKEAFIKMSKEFHPDKNKDAKAQERFVNIVEAYNVLGKPSSRAQYDFLSANPQTTFVHRTHVPWNLRKNPAYQYQYHYQDTSQSSQSKQQQRKEKSYYGMTGVQKVPNSMIIMICFGFALVGLVIQMYVIRHSFLIHRETIDEKSRIAAQELDKVRAVADENGNESEQVPENIQDEPDASIPGSTNHPLGDLGALFGDLFLLPDEFQVEESKSSLSLLNEVLQPEDEVELQTRLLLEKIVNGANATVATASLGQSLVTEKKETPSERVLTEYGLSEDAGGDWYTSSFRSSIKKNPLGLAFEIETWFE